MSIPKLPKAYSERGAQMGRRDSVNEPDAAIRFHLVKMRLDRGGYDEGGAYWGLGTPMWRAVGEGPETVNEMFFRAGDRDEAKQFVRDRFRNATFWR